MRIRAARGGGQAVGGAGGEGGGVSLQGTGGGFPPVLAAPFPVRVSSIVTLLHFIKN